VIHVRTATLADRPEIIRISKQSKYTKGVSNPMFMDDKSFEKGEVGVAFTPKLGIVGFTAVHHLVRRPYTSLYYIGVDERFRSRRIGEHIVDWVLVQSPHSRIRLICEVSNPRAHAFYERLGFTRVGRGANKSGEPYYIFYACLNGHPNCECPKVEGEPAQTDKVRS
jgi:ribosomal protein S18 acetylase RimI-like enzyme